MLRTVKVERKGRTVRVKRCRKRKPASKPVEVAPPVERPTAPATQPPVAPPGGQEDSARLFVESRLTDSRFTTCPAGRGPGCTVEVRYSHFAGGAFAHCRLTPLPPASFAFASTYAVRNPVVASDGSWSFEAVVPEDGGEAVYTWRITADGKVAGTYVHPGDPPAELPELQYVAGARDCSS